MATSNVYLSFTREDMFNSATKDAHGTGSVSHPGAVEVLSYSFAINQIGSEEPGRPRSVEKVARSPLTIVKAADSRTPRLFRYCVRGEFITKARLQVFGPDPTKPYLTYTFSYVHVSSFEPSGGAELSTETIGLSYGQMEVEFDNQGLGTSIQGNSKTGKNWSKWSWVMEMPETIGAIKLGG